MTKLKVTELEGLLLDMAVAKAMASSASKIDIGGHAYHLFHCASGEVVDISEVRRYSLSWGFSGQIIEKEGIWLSCSDVEDGREWFASFSPHTECYSEDDNPEVQRIFKDRSPLVAAMRAYVASRLGAEVDL